MNVNSDFSQRIVMHGDAIEWQSSPMPGVHRRRLDRVKATHDRVTTIVRYAPGCNFSPHVHEGGEEFVVLEGVFEDDYGQWPAGSYVRNPPQSSHTPGSTDGCVIFVKLWQFNLQDRSFVHAHKDKLGQVADRYREGVHVSPLYKDEHETVVFERWEPGAQVKVDCTGGAEIFVLSGEFDQCNDTLRKYSWLRMPVDATLQAQAGAQGTSVWIKTGHLRGL